MRTSTESGAESTPAATTTREEMVQVAAVAVAIIEAIDHGSADRSGTGGILEEIDDERWRQNQKWGAQSHPIPVWLAILMEEVGEAAQAYLEGEFNATNET